MAKLQTAMFDCPVCGETVRMAIQARPLFVSTSTADWEVTVDTEPLRAHLAAHSNEDGAAS
jgi:hypothetical protein